MTVRIIQLCARCGKPMRQRAHDGFAHLDCHPRWPRRNRWLFACGCILAAFGVMELLARPVISAPHPAGIADVACGAFAVVAAFITRRPR